MPDHVLRIQLAFTSEKGTYLCDLHTRFWYKATLASALLTLTGLTLLPSAQAQSLTLGDYSDRTASGTATLTDTETTATGTYFYNDQSNGTPLNLRTSYQNWYIYGPSAANVNGGSIGALETYNNSTANVSGGILDVLATWDTSTVNVSGRYIYINGLETINSSTANVSGGNIRSLYTLDTSTINLFGTGFTETFVGSRYSDTQYLVQGTLQDGTAIDATYDSTGGQLIFRNPVPEASTTVSLGLLLALGLGGMMIAAKRKKGSSEKSEAAV